MCVGERGREAQALCLFRDASPVRGPMVGKEELRSKLDGG